MKTVIIGAGGFVGSHLSALLATRDDINELALMDMVDIPEPARGKLHGTNVSCTKGSFADPQLRNKLVDGADQVIVLASILGGAAEQNYALARQINVDATLNLFEHLRDKRPQTRVVFASTIAVYAKPLPPIVNEQTKLAPSMVYGAQKLMMEVALSNFQARGWLDGVSVRPSGVMARDGADERLKTAFMSRVFYAVARNQDIVLPVAPTSTTWLTSVDCVAQNFAHAAFLSATELGAERAFTLPALRVSFEQLVAALYRAFPNSSAKVTYAPDDELIVLFGHYPDLETPIADRLGFVRDEDANALVKHAMTAL